LKVTIRLLWDDLPQVNQQVNYKTSESN